MEVAIPAAAVGLKEWQREVGFNIGRNAPGAGNQSWNPSWSDTSGSRLILEGAPEVAAIADDQTLASSPQVVTVGKSLRARMDRQYARPGERWIEAAVQLVPARLPLAQTRLDVKLYALSGAEPVEKLSVVPTGGRATLRVDLRSAKLDKGELSIELFGGDERTGMVKAFVAALSEPPMEQGRKIAVKREPN